MLQDIRELLKGTFLEDAMMMELEIPRTTDIAIAIAVKSENAIEAWKLLKSHIDQTQRYPVLTSCMSRFLGDWEQGMVDQDFFNRFSFDQEYREELTPEAIIEKADLYDQNDLEEFLSSWAEEYSDYDPDNEFDELIDFALEDTRSNFGNAPLKSEIIQSSEISTIVDVERYLFYWEQKQNINLSVDLGYQQWFDFGGNKVMILLPNPHSWNTLAYLHWYGGSRNAIPLMKKWYQDCGANLIFSYGTIIEFILDRRPTESQLAFEIAWEQVALAPCTIFLPGGISIRDHARALLELDRWFLHERP